MAGGADANEIFDEANGFRFFLDADYELAATSCTGDGVAVEGDLTNAIEITNEIITTITSFKTDTVEIANGSITPTRMGKSYAVEVNTEASAASDDLATINPANHSEGDVIILRGQDNGRVATLNETGNIDLAGGVSFDTGSYEKAIGLQLWAKGGAGFDELFWFELFRSTPFAASISDQRDVGIPVTSQEGSDNLVTPTSGTVTLTVNVDKRIQDITGNVTLTGDLEYVIDVAGSEVDGDYIYFKYEAQTTVGAFNLTICGRTLTANMALIGGWIAICYFASGVWRAELWPIFGAGSFQLETDFILDEAITPAKLSGDGATELIPVPLSFETNGLGDHKAPMEFDGTVIGIKHVVGELIEATDDASIVVKDAALAVMSTKSITGGSATGVTVTDSPTVNNTFVKGDTLTLSTAKVTGGGRSTAFLEVRRT
jgi:hypothetical protein